jgi:hypothetical protein
MDTKICNMCGRSLPATKEYFFGKKAYKDGMEVSCKECRGRHFTEINLMPKEGFKICMRCKSELSLNNFYKDNSKEDGLNIYCKECIREKSAKRYEANIEKERERSRNKTRKYYKENRGKILAKAKVKSYENHKKYYESHKSERLEKNKAYRLSNAEQYRNYCRARRSKKQNSVINFSNSDWEECLKYFDYKDAYTGLPMETVSQDHVIPLSKGGGYTKQNIVPCEGDINSSKGNRDMEIWFRKQDFFNEERLQKIYNWIGMKDNIQQLSIL